MKCKVEINLNPEGQAAFREHCQKSDMSARDAITQAVVELCTDQNVSLERVDIHRKSKAYHPRQYNGQLQTVLDITEESVIMLRAFARRRKISMRELATKAVIQYCARHGFVVKPQKRSRRKPLPVAEIKDIFLMYHEYGKSQSQISREKGISEGAISLLLKGKRRKEITEILVAQYSD